MNGTTKHITSRAPTTRHTLTALWGAGETYDHHYAVSVIADGITHHRRQHAGHHETEHTDPNLN